MTDSTYQLSSADRLPQTKAEARLHARLQIVQRAAKALLNDVRSKQGESALTRDLANALQITADPW